MGKILGGVVSIYWSGVSQLGRRFFLNKILNFIPFSTHSFVILSFKFFLVKMLEITFSFIFHTFQEIIRIYFFHFELLSKSITLKRIFFTKLINSFIFYKTLPFHLLPSPVNPTGFSFCLFPGFLSIFILLSLNNRYLDIF